MKCEQGDLAKIIHSIRPANIGKTVLVEEYIGRFTQGEAFDFRGITCRAPVTDHYWWVAADHGLTNMLGESPKVYIADSWLDPVRPDLQSTRTHETVDDAA